MKPLSSITVAVLLVLSGCQFATREVALQPPPARFTDHAEFGPIVKQAGGQFLGCYGYSVSVPGLESVPHEKLVGRIFPIPGTSDNWKVEGSMAFNERAWKFAEDYNRWLFQHPKAQKPNKAPEPTPTSVMPRATSSESERSSQKEIRIPARGMPAAVVAHL